MATETLHSSHPEFRGPLSKVGLKSRMEEKEEKRIAEEREERECYRAVDARDRFTCRVCGCRVSALAGMRPDALEHHHITFRSAGGQNTTENVCTLCRRCHEEIHLLGMLQVAGNANAPLEFSRPSESGEWFTTIEPKTLLSVERTVS